MKISIIGAIEEEVTLLRDRIENRQTIVFDGCEIYASQLNGTEVALLKPGTGEVAAVLGAILLPGCCRPGTIINTGSTGDLASTLRVGNIIVSDETHYHDTDVAAFGCELGQLSGCPAGFKIDPALTATTGPCIVEPNLNAVHGLIVSGGAFVNGSAGLAKIKHNFPQVAAVEIEATTIAYACHNPNVSFVVIRAVSDVADQQPHLSFGEFLVIAAKQSSLMIETLIQKLTHG